MLVLPFWLNFDPAARGIGAVTEHRSFARWAGDMALIYGVLGWGVLAAYAGRLLAARQRVRIAAWGGVGAAFVLSLLAPRGPVGDRRCSLAALGVAVHAALTRRLEAPERFLWLLVAGAVACVLAPELVYVRDEFDGSALYRMNTVFKLGYQAFVLLAIAAACALPWAGRWLPRRAWAVWAAIGAVLLLLGLVFPYAGNWARRDGFSRSPTLDGLGWLRASAPGDVGAIEWLRAQRARRRRAARGRRPGLLGLRPRAHVHLHRPPDGDRLGRATSCSGSTTRAAGPTTCARCTRPPTPTPRGRC